MQSKCDCATTSDQQHNQQLGGDSWQWGLLSLSNIERLCQPDLKCSGFIHPHMVNKVADTCVQIRTANVSRSAQVFATILLLQMVTNHTRYAKK